MHRTNIFDQGSFHEFDTSNPSTPPRTVPISLGVISLPESRSYLASPSSRTPTQNLSRLLLLHQASTSFSNRTPPTATQPTNRHSYNKPANRTNDNNGERESGPKPPNQAGNLEPRTAQTTDTPPPPPHPLHRSWFINFVHVFLTGRFLRTHTHGPSNTKTSTPPNRTCQSRRRRRKTRCTIPSHKPPSPPGKTHRHLRHVIPSVPFAWNNTHMPCHHHHHPSSRRLAA